MKRLNGTGSRMFSKLSVAVQSKSARPQRQLPTSSCFLKSLYYRIGILPEARLVGKGL